MWRPVGETVALTVVRTEPKRVTLRVLHYSDIEGVYDSPERIGRLAGLLAERRDESTLVLGTGDNTGPSALSLVTDGRQSLDFFDAVRPHAETFGNHDFDHGLDALRRIVRESPQPWVSANVRDGDDAFAARDGVRETAVIETAGVRVGLVGLTTPETPAMATAAEALAFDEPIEAAHDAIDRLRYRSVDYVIVLSHLGEADDRLARTLDVDAILGGHVHDPRIDLVEGTVLTRPGVGGASVVELVLDGDSPTVRRHGIDDARSACDTLIADLHSRFERAGLADVVATIGEPMGRTDAALHRESRVGNFVADAYRWAADADVAVQNAGGIREGPPLAGPVTVGDLIGLVPFDGPLVVLESRGSELLEVFRQVYTVHPDAPTDDRWHAHVSGAAIAWDETAGGLSGATVGDDPVDPEARYTVATNEYVATAVNELPAFDPASIVRREGPQYEVLVEYARERGIDPSIEGRLRRVA